MVSECHVFILLSQSLLTWSYPGVSLLNSTLTSHSAHHDVSDSLTYSLNSIHSPSTSTRDYYKWAGICYLKSLSLPFAEATTLSLVTGWNMFLMALAASNCLVLNVSHGFQHLEYRHYFVSVSLAHSCF